MNVWRNEFPPFNNNGRVFSFEKIIDGANKKDKSSFLDSILFFTGDSVDIFIVLLYYVVLSYRFFIDKEYILL